LAKIKLRELIDPILRATVARIKDSCALAIRDGGDSITIGCWNAPAFGAVNINVGLRVPLYVSTPGRVLLCNLTAPELHTYMYAITPQRFTTRTVTSKTELLREIEQIRAQGFAVGREEFEPGVYALAVPLKLPNGRTAAALTAVGNAAKIASTTAVDERIE